MNNRRKFLFGALGFLAAGGAGVWFGTNWILKTLLTMQSNGSKIPTEAPDFEANCTLTADATEGPYFVTSAVRRDIRDGKPGKELALRLKLANMKDCSPVSNAKMEIWHCDAEGVYSGYPEELSRDLWGTMRFLNFTDKHVDPVNEKLFLRGAQVTDSKGVCEFTTILPGWYEGRCPHIHFKIFAGEKDVFTSQLFFNEELTRRVYTTIEPYKKYGESPYTMANDIVIGQMKEHSGLLLNPAWSDSGELVASAKIGLKLT